MDPIPDRNPAASLWNIHPAFEADACSQAGKNKSPQHTIQKSPKRHSEPMQEKSDHKPYAAIFSLRTAPTGLCQLSSNLPGACQ
jgi:hypothetical protein